MRRGRSWPTQRKPDEGIGALPCLNSCSCSPTAIEPSKTPPSLFDAAVNLAKAGLTVTLFFIGASLTRDTVKKFGYRALLQGVILWIVITVVTLFAVTRLT